MPDVNRLEVGQRFMKIFGLASFARDRHVTLVRRRVAVTYALLAPRARADNLRQGLPPAAPDA